MMVPRNVRGLLRLAAMLAFATSGSSALAQSHKPDAMLHDGFDGTAAGPANDADASRFLAQATFGPTDADIAHLRAVGYQAWLNEQFAAPQSLEMTYLDWVGDTLHEQVGHQNRREAWFLGALGGPDPANNALIHSDQLRQRIAFALSEILVVSDQNAQLAEFPTSIAYYYDILVANAFGNYRTLLEKVTLSPAMGTYLNMACAGQCVPCLTAARIASPARNGSERIAQNAAIARRRERKSSTAANSRNAPSSR